MNIDFEFRPFVESLDLELVLMWLVETKRVVPGIDVDIARERKYYFDAVRNIQSRDAEFSSILCLKGKPIGYLCTFPVPKQEEIAWLDFCYLIPEVRGTEASDLLVSRVVNIAEKGGCVRINLNVHHKNPRAIAFYEKNGWVQGNQDENGLIRMRKSL